MIFRLKYDRIQKSFGGVIMGNTFIEGVDPDGLKDIADIKYMICYIISSVDEPLTKSLINDILQDDYSLANYFEVNQALSELLRAGTLRTETRDGEEILILNKDAVEPTMFLKNSLPRSIREKAINCAVKLLTRSRRERENEITVEKLDRGYNVTFTLFDVNTEFMKLTIYVSDECQVEAVKKNFLNDPSKFYSNIISSLTV